MANIPCSGKTDLFYRNKKEYESTLEAKALCDQCNYQIQCLQLATKERFGIWGGKTVAERNRDKRNKVVEIIEPTNPSTVRGGCRHV